MRERERECERTHGEPTRAENERRDTWRRIGKRAKDDNLGAERSCRLSAAVLKISIVPKKLGYLSKLAQNGYLTIAKVTHADRINFYVSRCATLRATEFNVLTHPNITALSKIYIYCHY